jgi:hypothetical protein
MSVLNDLDRNAELERIRLYTLSARQRVRRLGVLLDEQIRILQLDPALHSAAFRRRGGAYSVGIWGIRVFFAAFLVASLAAFYGGFVMAQHR